MSFIEKKKYYKNIFILGIILLIISIVFSTYVGVADISFKQTSTIILSKLPILNKYIALNNIKETSKLIILNLRLPRVILASLVGAGLSVVGASFQSIFKNPMADPYILGVSSGAAFGATLTIILELSGSFLGVGTTAVGAFIGAIITVAVVYSIARVGKKIPTTILLLSGIAISFMLSSFISLIMIFKREQIENIIMWTMGSLGAATWEQVIFLIPFIFIGIVLLYIFSRHLNIMLLGDDTAKNLGINTDKIRKILMIISSIIVAFVVSVSGVIGFIGLIIPHTIRMIFGADNRVIIPFSALGGAIFLILCDTLARILVPPMEIPVGIITSLFGVPFFIKILYSSKKKVI
ncbi:FecCD family ABC transporter permease [Clostridium massiliodielmoense]|uniref:FecCD family ABC transporter permease n=1 Tax=Clostridium massiliodielmoense TaxID=1776385 RepID=UPI0004D638A4|nr:iron ABC transporter permease [Clostridium massiliodielmoense]KEH96762.1 iron ABC transporter [Clostridium botulinum C/D str. BKT12695]